MTDKQLISNLKSLRNINPDAKWVKSNRDIVLTQISNSGATEMSSRGYFLINLQTFFKTASQPAFAMAVFVILLVTGSLFSHQLFNKTQPDESLYIARIISEKAKLNTIFNQNDRDKLAVQFAASHAQDIANVLSDPEFSRDNEVAVAKLKQDFKKEISVAKTRLNRLTVAPPKTEASPSEEETVSIANSQQDDQGLEIYQKDETPVQEPVEEVATNSSIIIKKNDDQAPTEEVSPDTLSPDQILEEAQASFEKKDYSATVDKLKKIDDIIK